MGLLSRSSGIILLLLHTEIAQSSSATKIQSEHSQEMQNDGYGLLLDDIVDDDFILSLLL